MFISKEKFDALVLQLQTAQDARADVIAALGLVPEATNEEIQTAISSLKTAGNDADTKLSAVKKEQSDLILVMDDLGATVKEAATPTEKVEAIRVLLAAKPGTSPTPTATTKDPILHEDGVKWDVINELPHNKEVDANKA